MSFFKIKKKKNYFSHFSPGYIPNCLRINVTLAILILYRILTEHCLILPKRHNTSTEENPGTSLSFSYQWESDFHLLAMRSCYSSSSLRGAQCPHTLKIFSHPAQSTPRGGAYILSAECKPWRHRNVIQNIFGGASLFLTDIFAHWVCQTSGRGGQTLPRDLSERCSRWGAVCTLWLRQTAAAALLPPFPGRAVSSGSGGRRGGENYICTSTLDIWEKFSLHCLVRQCHLSCQALPPA